MRVYSQTVSCQFGFELANLLADKQWKRLDVAVAWVRASGVRPIAPLLRAFLKRGGRARFVVGVDIGNTSKEGLEELLSLPSPAAVTFVRHNENRSVTFHPKVFLFSNEEHARLVVGSNNLTASGLFTNTEAGLQIDAAVTDPAIVEMRASIDKWCDTSRRLALRLKQDLLKKLERNGYVYPEETLRHHQAVMRRRPTTPDGNDESETLFGSEAPPRRPKTGNGGRAVVIEDEPEDVAELPEENQIERTLLLWPQPSRGGTQIQFPKALFYPGGFLEGVDTVTSDHDDESRGIPETHATRDIQKGKWIVNTVKYEVPEAKGIPRPILRLWRTSATEARYRLYNPDDQTDTEGRTYEALLWEGRRSVPRQTVVCQSSHGENRATWYRFI